MVIDIDKLISSLDGKYQKTTVHNDLEESKIEFEPLDEEDVNDADSTESEIE